MSNKEIYLLSETQLGFYYEWIKNPDLTEYNVPYKLILSQSVDANRLEKALYRVLHNNPIYYTCIKLVNGNAYQFIDNDNGSNFSLKAYASQSPVETLYYMIPSNPLNYYISRSGGIINNKYWNGADLIEVPKIATVPF